MPMPEAKRVPVGDLKQPRRFVYFVRDAQGDEKPKTGVLDNVGPEVAGVISLRGLRPGGLFSLKLSEQVIDLGPETKVKGPGHHRLVPGTDS